MNMRIKLLSAVAAIIFFGFTSALDAPVKVKYNLINKKYHLLSCEWAQKCTRNCIEITIDEAKKKKGIPCGVCLPDSTSSSK